MSSTRLSRDEQAKKKAIEEARKAGELPPEVDNEGNMINPHIPEFMSKAPWYLNQEEGAGLKHQRDAKKKVDTIKDMNVWYKRGKDAFVKGKKEKRYRKGACKNCGAMTHKEKDCLERPRSTKKSAWKTGKTFARDEVKQQNFNLSYDASRDRWNGYDANQQLKKIELYNKAEEERRKKALRDREEKYRLKKLKKEEKRAAKKAEKKKAKEEATSEGKENGSDSESSFGDTDSESENENSDADLSGVKEGDDAKLAQKMFTIGTAVKATVRNLRIREDTAKYLRNLDPNSAYYDPKTRSMRANPTPHIPLEESTYAGDNFISNTGEAKELAKAQMFAWEAQAKSGEEVGATHLNANPTEMMLRQKEFKERKEKLKNMKKAEVFAKYGGEEHLKKPDPTILDTESNTYVEYSSDGRVLKGNDTKQRVLSKYEEDVFPGNHTSVWGSYYDVDTQQWGFACCWQTNKKGYCTGEAGKKAKIASMRMKLDANTSERDVNTTDETSGTSANEIKGYDPSEKSMLYGTGNVDVKLDPSKLEAAKKRYEESNRREETGESGKRKYNSFENSGSLTVEDMEIYKRNRSRKGDPMLNKTVQ
mmetsp:Transcript_9614/g.11072  ORF Transcript_9614/g.11072 Transcript_9614/m.11072 type:complete len:592 (-) Transcript_9614:159-1934(-)